MIINLSKNNVALKKMKLSSMFDKMKKELYFNFINLSLIIRKLFSFLNSSEIVQTICRYLNLNNLTKIEVCLSLLYLLPQEEQSLNLQV